MKYFITFILVIFLNNIYSQDRDYKKYDKAVKLFNNNKLDKSKDLLFEIIDKNNIWDKPHLLLSTIYLRELDYYNSTKSLLNIYSLDNIDDISGIEEIANIFYSNGFYSEGLYYFNIICKLDSIYCREKIIRLIDNCNFSINSINDPVEVNFFNLGENINTSMSEIGPAITSDNKMLIFTRKVKIKDDNFQEDFYYSLKMDDKWQKAIAFPPPLNTNNNEGALSLSSDQSLLVYTACNREDGIGSCDLYYGNNDFKQFNFINVGIDVNTKYWESQACFSSDRNFLYFVSNRPGGYGGTDIWISKITKEGFSKPFNAGPIINTKYDEMSPYIHADNLTLYFSSRGHIGMGDYDLFISKRIKPNGNWGSVKNLGFPINNYKSQNSLVVSTDGKTAFYNNTDGGFGSDDIFSFELHDEVKANKVNDLTLEIISKKIGEEIVLKNVHFLNNSFELNENSFYELNKLAIYLLDNDINILIEGHTDSIGNINSNILLSNNRARSVFDYLLSCGVDQKKLSYKGYGDSKPISENNNQIGRSLNRRTSFIVQ
jgi:outer membrane protein OmpA-like peptidoglycan-associated protein